MMSSPTKQGLFRLEAFLVEDFFEAGAFVAYALMHVLEFEGRGRGGIRFPRFVW